MLPDTVMNSFVFGVIELVAMWYGFWYFYDAVEYVVGKLLKTRKII